ncbi:hypothetical protein [Haloarchaeobius sp. TZWWS8]|uniref:hypothetical protein n=1 Tax=Haloarchaeobius sp. TZWWS8 TaxID=3446121 RepID=UPI003EBD7138
MAIMNADGVAPAPSGTRLRDDPEKDDETQASDDYQLLDAVGSANLDIELDKNTGRTEESLGGMGSGTATKGTEREDNISLTSVSSSASNADIEQVEQAVETATGGRAFGSTAETEDIGSGGAVQTTSAPSNTQSQNPADTLPIDNLLLGALAVVALVFLVGGGLRG